MIQQNLVAMFHHVLQTITTPAAQYVAVEKISRKAELQGCTIRQIADAYEKAEDML